MTSTAFDSVLSIITGMVLKDKIRVLCADDHPLVHDGIAFALQFQKDMEFVGHASSGQEPSSNSGSFVPT
jgi:hypothetical protein